jgi:hypothetical protein
MAKHFYHIPLQKTLTFIKEHKSSLNTLVVDKKALEYHKQLGKSYYTQEVEAFITFFKIDKELDYALKTLEYFNSGIFIEELYKALNFSQFELKANNTESKAFFYAFCYVYTKRDAEGFEHFMQKTFIHYHNAFNSESNIHIDHKEMCHTLAKSKKVTIKESFGEEADEAFFKLLLDETLVVEEKGKRIKTLRKKAYKQLFYYLIDFEEKKRSEVEEVYEMMRDISSTTEGKA